MIVSFNDCRGAHAPPACASVGDVADGRRRRRLKLLAVYAEAERTENRDKRERERDMVINKLSVRRCRALASFVLGGLMNPFAQFT